MTAMQVKVWCLPDSQKTLHLTVHFPGECLSIMQYLTQAEWPGTAQVSKLLYLTWNCANFWPCTWFRLSTENTVNNNQLKHMEVCMVKMTPEVRLHWVVWSLRPFDHASHAMLHACSAKFPWHEGFKLSRSIHLANNFGGSAKLAKRANFHFPRSVLAMNLRQTHSPTHPQLSYIYIYIYILYV